MNIREKLSLFLSVCLVGFGLMSDTPSEPNQVDSDAALDTIAIINHINYAVEVIRTYNNVIALEEEYEKISADNLNLNCIRDEESLQLIRDILNTLNSMRMNDRARKWYRHVLTRDLKGAKINGMAKMATTVTSSLINGSGGFWSRFGQVAAASALAGVESIADYKKAEHEFRGQFEDKEFELDTEKLNRLHEMNDKLLESQWKLVQKYQLDDRLRVTGKEVRSLVSSLKTSDRKNVFRQLKPMQRKFEVYPIYWYYRAAMALSVEEYKDAINSCEHFERINRSLFRTDQMAASTAMIKIAAMMKQRPTETQFEQSEKESIKKGLETICTKNYNSENPDESIFCTSVYLFALDDVEMASTVLDALMSKLVAASQDEFREYCDLFTKPKESRKDVPPNMAYLAQCRMLKLAINQKNDQKINVERLKEICERDTTCSLEKLFYFGELRIKDIWEVAKKDVEKINLLTSSDCVVVEIPIAWFLLGNLDVEVEMMNGSNVVQTLKGNVSNRSHVMSSPHMIPESKDMAYVRITMPVQDGSLVGCDGARLRLNHVSWPVDIVYAPNKPLNNGDDVFVPVRVERFMGKDMNEDVMQNPILEAKKRFEDLKRLAEQGDLDAQVRLAICYFDGVGVMKDGHEAVRWVRNAADHGHAGGQFMFGTVKLRGLGGVAENSEEAVKWYRKSASQGFDPAQLELGRCYGNGVGVEKDQSVAVEWYRKAADQGLADAQFTLGMCYSEGEGVSKDLAEAIKWYRKAAEQGLAIASRKLYDCYRLGEGVNVNEKEAYGWLGLAATQGDPEAQFQVGKFYRDNDMAEEDKTEAVKWFRMAAEQGHSKAQFYLGVCYDFGNGVEKDATEAVKWYRHAADKGIKEAQYNLGNMYGGGRGVAKNDAEAVKWYRKAAEQGDADAQCNLGTRYYYGEGVNQDKTEAVKWYRKAAEQGCADAQNKLGVCYEHGVGVAQDKTEAVKWYRKAAEQDLVRAQCNLGLCYSRGNGVHQNDAEAVKWFRKAAKNGDNGAILFLGTAYFMGIGVSEDKSEAVKWWRKGAEQGDAGMQYMIGYCYEKGHGTEIDTSAAKAWYRKADARNDAEAKKSFEEFKEILETKPGVGRGFFQWLLN